MTATKYLKSSKHLSAKHSPTDRKSAAYSFYSNLNKEEAGYSETMVPVYKIR
jgi:hypothetical protein